ncbi:hypothetical protein N781_11305 [Pontibacillus halophilus JSM 076056 = DSM 19796]|uniref:DUF4190 domain-containing protein n=1 Tax=Pontibacillus halophilus JSM 076056 = DSM 19796 TaxID=1385510 RepID=A0A0A5GR26_9BACI|nr:DUF4190 domain-containing protein [Pontibacillus halophilus]KGX93605.1 hypothetical protein N781_11305 [Pontibacillus halophilus JSM 076056 = DSM 19796]
MGSKEKKHHEHVEDAPRYDEEERIEQKVEHNGAVEDKAGHLGMDRNTDQTLASSIYHGEDVVEAADEHALDTKKMGDDDLITDRQPVKYVEEEPALHDHVERERRDTEFAQEAAVAGNSVREPVKHDERESDMTTEANAGLGWIAVIVSIVSFFIFPIIFGAVGVIMGFMARRRGAETLGNTAIVAGAISVVLSLFFATF